MAVHGRPRATGDLDIWIRPTEENARRVWSALGEFGAPLHDLEVEELASPDLVLQIGIAPRRIDLMTSLTGISFDEAWPKRVVVPIEGVDVPVIGKYELVRNKKAVGRPRDEADVAELQQENG
ncbi:MAG: hypothetical protein ACREMK_04305 [Gemmatimonadota bacterium]